jgi:signal transduction histidine kinase
MRKIVLSEKEPGQTSVLSDEFALCIFRAGADGIPVFASNSFIRLLGFYSFDELLLHMQLNQKFKECFSPEKYSAYFSNNHLEEPRERKWIRKNGQTLLLREHCRPVKTGGGETVFFDCMVEDITDQVIIEKLINDVRAGDYSILKALPDFIFVISRDGRFIDYQSNYQKLFINKVQLKGQSIRAVFPAPISDQMLKAIEAALDSGGIEMFEFNLESGNVTEYFEARFVIAGHNIVLMILRDISTQKYAEIQIKKFTEELKHLNATKDKFFSIISHDLRTPINGLLGYAELLSKELDSLTKEEIKHFAGNIAEISKSTNTLLTNILDWSRIQTGRMYFNKQKFDSSKSAQRVINLLNASASNKKISLTSDVAAGTFICADENMLQSILINLAGNAVKFTHCGGTVKIDCSREGDDLHFTVADNGIGISESDMEKLFDSDIIFSTNGTAKENGTGLGLLLCKEFVEKHSGRIWAESRLKCGTIFHFTLPRGKDKDKE